jgi:thiol-disulfide isomerase/thioredoxin
VVRPIPVLILCVTFAAADDVKPQSPAEKLQAIQKDVKDAEDAFRKGYAERKDGKPDEKKAEELYAAFNKKQEAGLAAAFEIAKAGPKSDVGFAALEWVLTNPRSYHLPFGKEAIEFAAARHAENPKVGKIVAWVGYFVPYRTPAEEPARVFIRTVAEKNPDRTARAQAHLALALEASRKFQEAELKRSPDADNLAARAEAAYETLIKDYGECKRLTREDSGTVGEFAKAELFEIRHLRVGKVAPDIEGEDLDGKRFKLSDYRGKVVVVNFWASWCGPCMAMVPHERKLVERMNDRPFALVGINGDDDRAHAKKVTEKENMSWRSFWNGDKGPQGNIAQAWNVRGWPTIYVLDAKGAIRFKNLRGAQLDKAVDELLKEMESK